MLGEGVEIAQVRLQVVVDLRVIYLPVQMRQPVAQAHHAPHRQSKIPGNGSVFAEHVENIAVVLRRTVLLGGDDVVAEVEAGGDCSLQVILGCADSGWVREETLTLRLREGMQVPNIGLEIVEDAVNLLSVNHAGLVRAECERTAGDGTQRSAESRSIPSACASRTQCGRRHRGRRASSPG